MLVLAHARVIDGTAAPARDDQTIVIRGGNIAALGLASSTTPPQDATVVDLTGKSVIPGLVMMHEHLYYPTGPGFCPASTRRFMLRSMKPFTLPPVLIVVTPPAR